MKLCDCYALQKVPSAKQYLCVCVPLKYSNRIKRILNYSCKSLVLQAELQAFVQCASEYQLNGRPLHELCDHNYKVSGATHTHTHGLWCVAEERELLCAWHNGAFQLLS